MKNFKLTNLMISKIADEQNYYCSINDFTGAFACWATQQDSTNSFMLVAKAIEAYAKFLEKVEFPTQETVIEMTADKISLLTSEKVLANITQILALNQMKEDYICLNALSRNVYYHILRDKITQPL